MIKKTIVMTMLFAFVLGLTSTNAATIKAVKVQGNIPTNADDPFWTRYGPTFHKHQVVDLDPQMLEAVSCGFFTERKTNQCQFFNL